MYDTHSIWHDGETGVEAFSVQFGPDQVAKCTLCGWQLSRELRSIELRLPERHRQTFDELPSRLRFHNRTELVAYLLSSADRARTPDGRRTPKSQWMAELASRVERGLAPQLAAA
jgi:hypothetical protein